MIVLAVLSSLLIMLSFLASSMEAALFSVSALKVEQMCRRKLAGAQRLKRNKERIQDSIIALVVLNNLANIAGSIVVGNIAGELFDNFWLGVFTASLTFIIILFGEVVPKTIGERHAAAYSRRSAAFVGGLRIVFKPVIILIRLLMRPMFAADAASERTSEEEIRLLAHLGHSHGSILESENRLIHRVFQLNDILARDIMTPRTVVFALEADRLLSDAADALHSASFSRIPLYDDDLDHIIGIVYMRDLLSALARGHGGRPLRDFLEPVSFIPETARADSLLNAFQKNREHLAIVIDEFGGMAGVLSLEDILEQLVGEIVDEYDQDVDMRVKAKVLKERKL